MSIEPYNTYIIVNAKSGTALDLSGTDGYTVSGWERHGGDNQRWYLDKYEDTNQWTFRNIYNDKYLGLADSSSFMDDVPVQGVDYPVPWDIFPDEQDYSAHRILVPGTPFNVDLSNFGDFNNGTLVAIWGQWEGQNQTWRFEQDRLGPTQKFDPGSESSVVIVLSSGVGALVHHIRGDIVFD
ncbi:hypothetical protein C0993_005715 [Termitomyces sp. T159_Od127]|nr:hypothetical protein C0993_005715 [Termitomyces sp. T159_Od127]